MVAEEWFVAAPALLSALAVAVWWFRHRRPARLADRVAEGLNPGAFGLSPPQVIEPRPEPEPEPEPGLEPEPEPEPEPGLESEPELEPEPEHPAHRLLRCGLPEQVVLAQLPLASLLELPGDPAYREWLDLGAPQLIDLVVCDAASRPILAVSLRGSASVDTRLARERRSRLAQVLEAQGIPLRIWDVDALPGIEAVRSLVAVRQMPSGAASGLRVVASQVTAYRLPDWPARPGHAMPSPAIKRVRALPDGRLEAAERPAFNPAVPEQTPAR